MIETEHSRLGKHWTTASGEEVPALGAQIVPVLTDEWEQGSVAIHMADVNKVLASVSKICDAGNKVVFDN